MHKFIILFTALGMVANAEVSNATNSSHTYRINNYSETYLGLSCQEWADEYGDALDKTPDVQVLGSLCQYDRFTRQHRIVIRYEADNELPLVSTYSFRGKMGVYESEEECMNRITSEEQFFYQETGLKVFLSFCSHEANQLDRPWYVQVDGFGTPARKPQQLSWSTNAFYGIEADDLRDEIASAMQIYGYHLRHLVIRPSGSIGDATVFFYSPNDSQPTFLSQQILTLPSLPKCQEQLTNLRQQLMVSGRLMPIAAYCTSPYRNPNRFEVTLVSPSRWTDQIYSSETYSDFDTCLLNEERVGDKMRSVYGNEIVAAVCANQVFDHSKEPIYYVVGVHSK